MLLASSLVFLRLTQSPAIDTDIYFAEAKAGSNRYQVTADGSIDSVSKLNLQGYDIDSHLTLKMAGKTVTELDFQESLKQGTKVVREAHMTYKDGVVKIFTPASTKATEISVKISSPVLSNFHPQVLQSLYGDIKWDQKAAQEVSIFSLEALTERKVSVVPRDVKKITTADGTAVVKNAEMVINAITFNVAFTEDGKYLGLEVPSQKLQMVRRGFENTFEDPLAKFPELSKPTLQAETIETEIPMRDGILTKATIIRPKTEGKYPVILSRTPYGRKVTAGDGERYAKRGYVFISQDVRGTGESKGAFDPMVTERKDGYDSIDWISKQDWCDGNVGMIGASYGGFVQWAAAVEQHPALKCLIPQVSPPSSAMWNIPYENGVFTLLSDLWWLRVVDNPKGQDLTSIMNDLTNMKGLMALPLELADDKLLGFNSKIFSKWLERDNSTKWAGWHFDDLMPKVQIPALHISGWFDGDEIGTQRNWKLVRSGGNSNQWLVYGPWTHFFNTSSKLGNVDFGKDAIIDLDSVYLRWFDTWLKNKSVDMDKQPKVRYFVMGENKWRTSADWPPVEAKTETLKFEFSTKSFGPKTTAKLVGTLKKSTSVNSTYDPSKDKIAAEAMALSDEGQDAYVKESKFPKTKLLLRSEPFTKDTVVTGPVTVEFDFKSSAKDTDFYAMLFDLDPQKGYFPVARPGKLRASYLQGLDKQRFLVPGKVYHVKLELWDSANMFKKGHRLCLMLDHSIFPGAARNLGTDEPIRTGTKMVVQKNVIFSSVKSPGFISFKVVK